jgi:hypothetical protein
MRNKTAWGVTLGIKNVPVPILVTYPDRGLYGWKIDQHGILAFGNSKRECEDEFRKAYLAETGTEIAQPEHTTVH